MRHGLQLAGVKGSVLADLNIDWETSSPSDSDKIWVHVTSGNFHCFSDATDSPFAPVVGITAGISKVTVKESIGGQMIVAFTAT